MPSAKITEVNPGNAAFNQKLIAAFVWVAGYFCHMRIGVAVWSSSIPNQQQQDYVEALLASLYSLMPPPSTITIISDSTALTVPTGIHQLRVPLITSYFGLRRWYGKTLPALLKKEKTEALIIINGSPADVSIPQLPVFISPSSALLACNTWLRSLYKKYLAKRLQKAGVAGVVTTLQKPQMQKLYGVKEDCFLTTGYAVPGNYQPVDDWQQRELFLQKQTGGKEYFLYTSSFSEDRFLHLLKAFSLFKKRQQSNMQLLVPADFAMDKKLPEKLDTYKYRQDVQMIHLVDKELMPQLTACAYAVLFMEENSITAFPVAAAMQCHIPVIGFTTNKALREIAGEAALYTDVAVERIAEQMKLIYKDEALRQNLIFRTQQQAMQIDGRGAAEKILSRLETV